MTDAQFRDLQTKERTVKDPRASTDPVVREIVRTADRIMAFLDGVATAAASGGTMDNCKMLVELDRLLASISGNKKLKRCALIEPRNRVGKLDPRAQDETTG